MQSPKTPRILRRTLTYGAAAIGTSVTFAIAAIGAAAIHLRTPLARKVAVAELNKVLAGTFQGELRILDLRSLSLSGFEGLRAELRSADQKPLLVVDDVSLDVKLVPLATSLVRSSGDIEVAVQSLHIRRIDANLDTDSTGTLLIQRALEPKTKSEESSSSRGLHLALNDLALGELVAKADQGTYAPLDGTILGLAGDAEIGAEEKRVRVEPFRIGVRGRTPEPVWLSLSAEGRLTGGKSEPGKSDVTVHIESGAIRGDIVAVYDGSQLRASIDVPEIPPGAWQSLTSESVPIREPVSLHADIRGPLNALTPDLRARIGDGWLTVGGQISLKDEKRGHLTLVGKGIRPRSFSEAAPDGVVSLSAGADFAQMASGDWRGEAALDSEPTALDNNAVPAVHVRGAFEGKSADARIVIAEPGAPTHLNLSLRPKDDSFVINFDSEVHVAELSRVERLRSVAARGRVAARARGNVDVGQKKIDAVVDAELNGVAAADASVGRATAHAVIDGAFDDPKIKANVAAANVQLAENRARTFSLSAEGGSRSLEVATELEPEEGLPKVNGRARVRVGPAPAIDNATIVLTRNGIATNIQIGHAEKRADIIRADSIRVDGLGDPILFSFLWSPRTKVVNLKATKIDVIRAARFAGGPNDAIGANAFASANIDVTTKGEHTTGEAHVTFRAEKFYKSANLESEVNVAFTDDAVDGGARWKLDKIGDGELSLEKVVLGGDPFTPSSWREATGAVALRANTDLGEVARLLPPHAGVSELGGSLALDLRVARESRAAVPDLDLSLATRHLKATGEQPVPANPAPLATLPLETQPPNYPWRIEGIDVDFKSHVDGATGDSSVAVRLIDQVGALGIANARGRLPLFEWMKSGRIATAQLWNTPVFARVDVPERSFAKLPEMIRPSGFQGSIALGAQLEGTATEPKLDVDGLVRGVRGADSRSALPIDANVHASYDAKVANVTLHVSRPKEGRVAAAEAMVRLKFDDVLKMQDSSRELPWDADARVDLAEFPLHAIPELAARRIVGTVSGRASLNGLHKNAVFDSHIELRKLRVQDATIPMAQASLSISDGRILAHTRVDSGDGFADATVTGAMNWGDRVAPEFDAAKPVDARLVANNFRAAAVGPFVQDAVNNLDGRLNANAAIHLEPGFKDGKMVGGLEFSRGTVQVPALGEEFSDIHATVDVNPWGTVRVRDLRARGLSGSLSASAMAKLDGFNLQSGEAHVEIPKDQSMPLAVQGVPIGDAYGKIEVAMAKDPSTNTMNVQAQIPVFHLALPQSTGNSVQSLDPDRTVRVGTKRTDGIFALLPLEKPKKPSDSMSDGGAKEEIRVAVKLGDDVEVKRDTQIRLSLRGEPVIHIANQTEISGDIRVTKGLVEVLGKRFTIDRATVSFTGQPSDNPTVVATAHWDAPDGTRVICEVTGPVKTIKVRLHAEPARSQNEILALVLFGTADGAVGSKPGEPQQGTGSKAATFAGGFVAQGVNRALSGVSDIEIQTRLDTENSQNPRPEVQVQISPRVSIEAAYNLGVPAPGENPDRALLMVDWRVRRNWSLQTTFGDRGSSMLDLIWQKRY